MAFKYTLKPAHINQQVNISVLHARMRARLFMHTTVVTSPKLTRLSGFETGLQ